MTDPYTKSVLTIIAIALAVIAVRQVVPPATAQAGSTRVQLCDQQNCATLVPFQQIYQGRSYVAYGLPVSSTR
jgi:hypothetical protein